MAKNGKGRPSAPEDYTGINIYLYARHYRMLHQLAHDGNCSMSHVIRRLLTQEIEKYEQRTNDNRFQKLVSGQNYRN